MLVDFRRFLVGLGIVGVALGVVFGMGVAVGRLQKPATVASTAPTGAAAAAAAAAGGATGGAAGAGFGGGFPGAGAGGGAPVTGSVDSVSATSMTVKTAAGDSVTLTLNPQTTVRKLENVTLADIHSGDNVLVTRDASSVATSVQVVPPGTTLGGGTRGAGPAASATGTVVGTAPAGGGRRNGGATPTPTP
jgi:hypothetical protein